VSGVEKAMTAPKVGPEVIKQIHDRIVSIAKEKGLAHGTKMRVCSLTSLPNSLGLPPSPCIGLPQFLLALRALRAGGTANLHDPAFYAPASVAQLSSDFAGNLGDLEVLRVISKCTTDVQPVFDAIVLSSKSLRPKGVC
jgi:hypothetical protein